MLTGLLIEVGKFVKKQEDTHRPAKKKRKRPALEGKDVNQMLYVEEGGFRTKV